MRQPFHLSLTWLFLLETATRRVHEFILLPSVLALRPVLPSFDLTQNYSVGTRPKDLRSSTVPKMGVSSFSPSHTPSPNMSDYEGHRTVSHAYTGNATNKTERMRVRVRAFYIRHLVGPILIHNRKSSVSRQFFFFALTFMSSWETMALYGST